MRRLSIVLFGSCSLIYRFQLFLDQLVLDAEVFSETTMELVPRFNLGACLPQFLIHDVELFNGHLKLFIFSFNLSPSLRLFENSLLSADLDFRAAFPELLLCEDEFFP